MKKLSHIILISLFLLISGSSVKYVDPTIIIIGNVVNDDFINNDQELFSILSQQKIYWDNNKTIQIVAYNRERYINFLFYKKINRINNFFDVIWRENKYLGIGNEPIYFDTEDEVIEYVKKNPNTIGFITEESMDSEIKILYQL